MSIKSQEGHMRQLALLLTTDLGCIFDERESFFECGKGIPPRPCQGSWTARGYSQCKQRRHRGVDRAALMRGWEGALLSDDPKQQGLQRRIQSFSHQQRPENLVISAAFGDAECFAEGWVPL